MDKVRVILQARLSSSRLPGKVLLPVAGMPMVVLAAKRAGNTGLPVLVATSNEHSDDKLRSVVEDYGIPVFQGPLNDVHERYCLASEDLGDSDWIVRLTSDNVFPDGDFISNVLDYARKKDVRYVGTHSPFDGFPYGLSVEVFTAGALRIVSDGLNRFDREHVTPAIKRQFGGYRFDNDGVNLAHLRCTVDTFSDYIRILEVMDGTKQPVLEGWKELCTRLQEQPRAPQFRVPFKATDDGVMAKFTLGTAQLGLPNYGRLNKSGKPSRAITKDILTYAVAHGVTHIDCANAYGEAETRVGSVISEVNANANIVTKLSPLEDLDEHGSDATVRQAVESSIFRSLHALQRRRLEILMLHRWSHRHSHTGRIWRELIRLRDKGIISQLGVSVYDPEEAIEALDDEDIKFLQIPFNLVDYRWFDAGFPTVRKARPDVRVFGRSVFLQGILLSSPNNWPVREGFSPHGVLTELERIVFDLGRENRADLCIAFAGGYDWIDSLVFGVETQIQLKDNLKLCCKKPLTEEECKEVRRRLPRVPDWLLKPNEWPAT